MRFSFGSAVEQNYYSGIVTLAAVENLRTLDSQQRQTKSSSGYRLNLTYLS